MFSFHDSPFAGYLGVKKTLSRIRNRYFWSNMNKEIKMYVGQCVICEKRKTFGSSKEPLVPIDLPPRPWQLMAMDVVGPLELTERGNLLILVMGEYSTRYMIAEPMKDQTAECP